MKGLMFFITFALFSVTVLSSCSRLDLEGRNGNVSIVCTLDDDVLYNPVVRPDMVRFAVYDTETGEQVSWMPLYIEGENVADIVPGTYDIVAYSLGSEFTQFNRTAMFRYMTAESSSADGTQEYNVINAPDHAFITVVRNYTIPVVSSTSEKHLVNITLEPFLDSWKVEVAGVNGLCNLSSARFYIYNQADYYLVGDMTPGGQAIVSESGWLKCSGSDSLVVSTFNTFGMRIIPDDAVTVKIVLSDMAGLRYEKSADVTSQVEDAGNIQHILSFDFDITLQPLSTHGGFTPSADEWSENEEHWVLE